jgi:hypothetical protein
MPSVLLANDPLRDTAVPAAESLRAATAVLSAMTRATERQEGARIAAEPTQSRARGYEALIFARDFRRVSENMAENFAAYAATLEIAPSLAPPELHARAPYEGPARKILPARKTLPARLRPLAREIGVVAKRSEAVRLAEDEPRVRHEAADALRDFGMAAAGYGEALLTARLASADLDR